MRRGSPIWMVPLAAALFLPACREAPSDEHVIQEQAMVEHVDGTDLARITLTQQAAQRLDIRTLSVQEVGTRTLVPTAAVIVDPDGAFWVYTSLEPLVFIRHEIEIDRQEGGVAYLTDGPPVGTEVVAVGVPELYGAETGIGH